MKKNAFTLVELLAVIIVIAIVLVIAVPKLTNISEAAEKEKFKTNSNEIYNLVKSDFLNHYGGTLSSKSIIYTISSNEIQEGTRVLDTKLKENMYGYVEVDSSSDTKLILENDKFCMIKEFSDKKLNIHLINSNKCEMTGQVLFNFNLNGGELVNSSTSLRGTYSSNTQIPYPTVKKEGYTFESWILEKGDAILGEDYITIGSKNSSVKAMWSKLVNLTVDLDGGILNDSLQNVYKEGSTIILPIPSKSDYAFTGWKVVDGNAVISGDKIYFGTTDVTIKATYKHNFANLVLDFDGGSAIGDVSGAYTIKTKLTLPTPTKAGYDFVGWEVVSGNSVLSGNTITIGNQDTIVKAKYKSKTYIVTLNANGGEISSNTLTVTYGEMYENLPVPTKQYYTFLGWYTDSEGGDLIKNTSLVSIAANHILYAHWGSALLSVTYEYLINNYSCDGATKGTPVFTYTGKCEILDDSSVLTGAWRIKFKTSGVLTFSDTIAVDVFLVGGGGGGADGYRTFAGNGGGGGYTVTAKNNIIESNANYPIVIGDGGANGGGQAPSSTAFGYVAQGGNSDGSGGSGGGAGGYGSAGKPGASYGASSSSGKAGQGTTTCEFGEGTTTGCLRGNTFAYSSGGGGGGSRYGNSPGTGGVNGGGTGGIQTGLCDCTNSGTVGNSNTGAGGGGGGAGLYTNVNNYYTASIGSYGGSGVVVIRNAR